jgi:hypothetical protein
MFLCVFVILNLYFNNFGGNIILFSFLFSWCLFFVLLTLLWWFEKNCVTVPHRTKITLCTVPHRIHYRSTQNILNLALPLSIHNKQPGLETTNFFYFPLFFYDFNKIVLPYHTELKSGPSLITTGTWVLELSTRIFYDELRLSTTNRGTQTQLMNGDIVLIKLE